MSARNITDPLPQTTDAQCMVISSVLDNAARYYEAAGILSEREFDDPCLRWAWIRIGDLCSRNQRPTMFNLKDLPGSDLHFPSLRDAMAGLNSCIPAQVLEYARLLVDRSALKRIALAADLLQTRASTAATASDAREAFESAFMDVCGFATNSKGFRRADAIVADLEERLANPQLAPRYKTGFPTLDHLLSGGLKAKQFTVIGGRTGGGKTVLAMNLAVTIAAAGTPVATFSLEMDDVDLITRCVLAESWRGDEAMETVRKLPLFVDDTSNVTLKSIAARIKMMIMRHGVKVFIVDYLQLIGTDGQERDSRERIVAGMSRLLKVTAKETDCCIIALSQLNESGELRESRAIEQDSDLVLYVIDNDDGDSFLRVCKQRGGKAHGPMKRMKEGEEGIPLNWTKENFRFTERQGGYA